MGRINPQALTIRSNLLDEQGSNWTSGRDAPDKVNLPAPWSRYQLLMLNTNFSVWHIPTFKESKAFKVLVEI